ncbi:hypothetical protein AADZ90_021250 [Aestuariibius sp. 2305UL40-4]|uniref:hypothetical protein n=1 Tax=Aestuariibius violaceus TaxID=3234132 RepID=UPI00398EDD31
MTDSPLPCPFCGSRSISAPPNEKNAICGSCLCYGPPASEGQSALEAWNARIALQLYCPGVAFIGPINTPNTPVSDRRHTRFDAYPTPSAQTLWGPDQAQRLAERRAALCREPAAKRLREWFVNLSGFHIAIMVIVLLMVGVAFMTLVRGSL